MYKFESKKFTEKQKAHFFKLAKLHKGRKKSKLERIHISQSKLREKHPRWMGGRYIDDAGYVDLLMPEWPTSRIGGYIREHRYVMEKHLGRPLEKNEHVHHKDGNKQNNSIDNLEVLDISVHARLKRKTWKCSIEGCRNIHTARGYCKQHWQKYYYYPKILKGKHNLI